MHYYTIRNRVTGERTLVVAPNRTRAFNGFAKRRLAIELTGQQELVELTRAGVGVLDLGDDAKPTPAPPGEPFELPGESIEDAA